MKRLVEKQKRRLKRKKRIRKTVSGTSIIPRVIIYRSNKYVYVQAIDDISGNTIEAVSNLESENKNIKSNVSEVGAIGKILGEKLKSKNIDQIVFDRNGFKYHGIVKSVAEGIREAGIKF